MDKFKIRDLLGLTIIFILFTYTNYVGFIQDSTEWTNSLVFMLIELVGAIFAFIILNDIVNIDDRETIETVNVNALMIKKNKQNKGLL